MSQKRWARQDLLVTLTGKRPRSRPRTRLCDYISNLAWSRLDVEPADLSEAGEYRDVLRVIQELLPTLSGRKAGVKMNDYIILTKNAFTILSKSIFHSTSIHSKTQFFVVFYNMKIYTSKHARKSYNLRYYIRSQTDFFCEDNFREQKQHLPNKVTNQLKSEPTTCTLYLALNCTICA